MRTHQLNVGEKIVRSTEAPASAKVPSKGRYTVQPVPAPASTTDDASSNKKEGGSSQKLMLFIQGKAISDALIIRGTSQFLKPPIMMGMTINYYKHMGCYYYLVD